MVGKASFDLLDCLDFWKWKWWALPEVFRLRWNKTMFYSNHLPCVELHHAPPKGQMCSSGSHAAPVTGFLSRTGCWKLSWSLGFPTESSTDRCRSSSCRKSTGREGSERYSDWRCATNGSHACFWSLNLLSARNYPRVLEKSMWSHCLHSWRPMCLQIRLLQSPTLNLVAAELHCIF